MTSAVRWLVTVLAGDVASTPRLCDGCGRLWTRLTPDQCTEIGSDRLPTCRRLRCTGRLWPVWPEATDRLIRDLRKTAAPGATGTAATADYLEGPPAMSHDLTFERTTLGQQMTAAMVLAHLIERGPREEAEWKIDRLGHIHGHVHRPHSDEQARRTLDQFANFLGSVVARSQGHGKGSEWIHLCASGDYRGVQVNVWTHVAYRVTNPYGSTR
jgi:hypothetical protein